MAAPAPDVRVIATLAFGRSQLYYKSSDIISTDYQSHPPSFNCFISMHSKDSQFNGGPGT